jgi:hypothetical protein
LRSDDRPRNGTNASELSGIQVQACDFAWIFGRLFSPDAEPLDKVLAKALIGLGMGVAMITIRIRWWKLVLVLLILANLLLFRQLIMEPVEPEQWLIPIYYSDWQQT